MGEFSRRDSAETGIGGTEKEFSRVNPDRHSRSSLRASDTCSVAEMLP